MSKATSKAKAKASVPKLVVGLYRRAVAGDGFDYPARFAADVRANFLEVVASGEGLGLARSRVSRNGLVHQVMPSGRGRSAFANLPVTTAADVTAIKLAVRDGLVLPESAANGLALPGDSLGRVLGAALATGDTVAIERKAESVRLWLKQRVAPLGLLHGEDLTIIVVPVGTVTD
jgi:hypothetical protein